MSVANQNIIIIERSTENAKRNFLKVSNNSLYSAMYNLNPNGFLLWIYFVSNANGYKMNIYPIDIIEKTNMSRSTYYRAFNELVNKGYIIKSNKQNNLYLFKEISDKYNINDNVLSIDKYEINEIINEYFSQK